MIPRYTRPEMAHIWTDENKFKIMLEVEILACEAMANMGKVPKKVIPEIRRKAKINAERINEIEATVKHDVIAFLTQVNETIGPNSRFLHMGMTSSDVLDTALAVQLKQSGELLLKNLTKLLSVIKPYLKKHQFTPMMGRTHGVHAEPITFGLKMASWYSEIRRAIDLMECAKDHISYGKISGAVGTFAHLNPKIEAHVCKKLGLKPEPVSTQIVPRDRHAYFMSVIAIIAASLERFAVEVRNLAKTEVREIEEPFSKGQKGSSAMPHKKNPILSENICGLARLIRGFATTSLENIALWHERDISHSSAERVILPDATIALNFMLVRITNMIAGLQVYKHNMMANLEKSQDIIFSGKLLLALVDKGYTREQAYAIVQKNAFISRNKNIKFEVVVHNDEDIKKSLSNKELKKCFELKDQFKNVPFIIQRVLKS